MPAKRLDAAVVASSLGGDLAAGEVWTADTTVSGQTHTVLFAANNNAGSFELGKSVAVEANSTGAFVRGPAALPLPASDEFTFGLWNVAPVGASGWALLGEVATKWVGVSPARVTAISEAATTMSVRVKGAAAEKVTLLFAPPTGTASLSLTCEVSSGGSATFNVATGNKGSCA